ncbi:MAG: hypothetical protein QN122_01440 [Armatimonadota bacterium]|nr:hypothetical protein [Armatimonadota bacterium]MDR7448882.1 hypothetical protein [Armatimonadota bacterium]MDR7460135.1 hypothetical protein [Armatimonadota bacterium]MDR7479238.1 hypothetical protein [Armatimonadota bacterium]MDR7487850.1 hypothetical protein [Armatimonadota bacterium]
MVWQLVFLLVLAAGLAVVMLQNPAVLQQAVTLTLAGTALSVRLRDLLLVAAGGWVLMLLGGLFDMLSYQAERARLQRLVADRDRELAAVKAEVYDRDRGLTTDLRTRLDTVDQELRLLRARVEDVLRMTELQQELTPPVRPEGRR